MTTTGRAGFSGGGVGLLGQGINGYKGSIMYGGGGGSGGNTGSNYVGGGAGFYGGGGNGGTRNSSTEDCYASCIVTGKQIGRAHV